MSEVHGIGKLVADDRVLVLGATGWFGRTLLAALPEAQSVLGVAASARESFVTWDTRRVAEFAPTVVANFAFRTRERVSVDGEGPFRAMNLELTDQFIQAAALPTVRAALTVSSGAAVTDPSSPYGEMKLAEERKALALIGPSRAVVVARAYSVSGPFVRRPRDYAFSDLVMQAAAGRIHVMADRPVFRRYVAAADFIQVCLDRALSGWSGVIESGGELIELGDLALRVARLVNPDAVVSRAAQSSAEPSIYASDDASWTLACRATGIRPLSLDDQITAVADGLLPGRRGL